MTTYAIIGGGIAGTTAAEAIREQDSAGDIHLFETEASRLYSRILLPNYLAGRSAKEGLVIRNEQWYTDRKINLNTEATVASIDKDAKKVLLSENSAQPYDKLLLATGARSFVIPFPGHELPGVLSMCTIDDVEKLKQEAEGEKNAVVIGGGLLGLEMASGLSHLGLNVTVIEIFPWLLPRQLDKEGGDVLKTILEEQGLDFRLDAKVASINGTNHVESIQLEGGEQLATKVILVSAGIRPNLDLAKEAGIQVDKGIVIDDSAATSHPDIFAAGDCTEHKGRIYGIWPAAEAQGRVAGTVMGGGTAAFTGIAPSHRLKVSGVDLFSIGEFDKDDENRFERVAGEKTYRKVVFNSKGNPIGAILIGDLKERSKLSQEINASK